MGWLGGVAGTSAKIEVEVDAELGNEKDQIECCQTLLQLAHPTQLQLVGEGVDFVFPWKEEGTTPS